MKYTHNTHHTLLKQKRNKMLFLLLMMPSAIFYATRLDFVLIYFIKILFSGPQCEP